MKKKIIPILALSTIALAGLAGCNLNSGSVSDYYGVSFINEASGSGEVAAPFTVTALDNNNIVSGNAVKVRKGEALNVKVTFTEADYTDFSEFFKYGTMSIYPNGSIVDSLIIGEEPEPIDESNYTLTYDLKNLSEWTLNIPKSVMTQSYKVTFSAHYIDLNKYYDEEALEDLFRPLSDASELGKTNLLADFTKIDDKEHVNYLTETPYIHPIRGFTTTLYPNYLLGYTFDESDLANLKVYSVDEKGQVGTKLNEGTDYSVELSAINSQTSGSRASTGYATGSFKFKFHMTPKQMFIKNEKGEIVPKYAGLKTFISNKGGKTEISNNKYVNTYNDPEHPFFHINEASTSLATVKSFEFNKVYLGDKKYDLAVTFETKDSTKYLFPKKDVEKITSDNLPVKKLSVTSDTNAFGVKFFEDYNAAVKDPEVEDETIIDVKDAFLGQNGTYMYVDNYGWKRLALYNVYDLGNQTFDFECSADGKTITVKIHLQNFLKNIEFANGSEYGLPDLHEGSFNFINSFVLDVEPTAIQK